MHDIDINIKNVSKIEGHTHLDVKVREGRVVECKLKVSENKRFFTTAILGKEFNAVPTIMSRICGTCGSAHTLCSIEAVEKAFNVNISKQSFLLKRLLINAGHLRDHAMHLYFFCLPDIFGKDSVLDFDEKEHEWIHDGLEVKEAGNYLSTIVGGRAVHPPNVVIGGFIKFPSKEEIKKAREKLEKIRKKILKLIEVFYKDKKTFKRKTNYVALVSEDYNLLRGFIKTAYGSEIPEEKYGEHLEKVVLPYATATGFEWESEDYMVGALARLNLNKENLHSNTKKDAEKYLKVFPSDCVFNNNLAQAIEMLHEADSSIEILKYLEKTIKEEKPVKVKPRKSRGVGVIEAPRGTLYYDLRFDEEGKVEEANLCIPTQQNIIHLEKDMAKYIQELVNKKVKKEEISLEAEKLIRAYDPCMSCATHFLKINWIEE